jgi:uncharacterized membrane protein
MTRISASPIFGSYWVVAVMTTALVLLLFVAPRFQQLPVIRRRALVVLRLLLIVLLALAMLRPGIVSTSTTPQSAVLMLLFDQSGSMQLPAAASDQSRWLVQQAVLEQIEDELADFTDGLEVRVYAYDHDLHPVELENGHLAIPPLAAGGQTDIGSCLHDAMTRELGRRLAGIVLLGDGTQTAPAPRVELQQSIRELARLDCPLYTVAFGPLGATTQSRDIALENMPDRFSVFVKNELVVRAALRVRGFVNKSVGVQLILEDSNGKAQTIGARQLSASSDDELVPISIPFIPQAPGEYKLTMRAADQVGELVTQNNELTAFLTVLEGGLRVLYLYGDLVGEQQRLRRSIDAAPDIQLDDLFVNVLGRDRWPIDLAARLQRGKYDVILVESVDASALAEKDMQQVAELVGDGTGLMMIGGYNSFGAGGYHDSPWEDLLPVVLGRFERQDLDPTRPISNDLHLWGELKLKPRAPHPVTLLGGEAENETLWRSLPPLLGANKLRPKPSARVLLDTTESAPVLVSGEYGRGRVLAFAGNTTGRWWQYGRETEHRRFWRQAILWLVHREDLDKNDVWIKLAQRRFSLGSEIPFEAGALTAGGQPISDIRLTAKVSAPETPAISLSVVADGSDFRGIVPSTDKPGDYLIEVTASRGDDELGRSQARFQVIDRDVELSNPVADYEQMARIANATRSAGGRPIAAEELERLLQEIHRSHQEVPIELQSKWQLGDTSLDAWLLFFAVLALVTSEWIARKRWGLV